MDIGSTISIIGFAPLAAALILFVIGLMYSELMNSDFCSCSQKGQHRGYPGNCPVPRAGRRRGQTSVIPLLSGPESTQVLQMADFNLPLYQNHAVAILFYGRIAFYFLHTLETGMFAERCSKGTAHPLSSEHALKESLLYQRNASHKVHVSMQPHGVKHKESSLES
ncbi:LOW QUALITY PROTEIN: arylacetamide deacetylase-like 4 [Fundulus diaphanus]